MVNSDGKPSDRVVLSVAMEAGHILLGNGAEIFRVEETMERICSHYGVKERNFFVLSNGIFTTGGESFAKVEHIPVKGTQLDRVVAVNQLSREIEQDMWSIDEVQQKLREIRQMPGKKQIWKVLASGIGAAAFCVLFGGSMIDALPAFIAGIILQIFVWKISEPHMSRIVGTILGAVAVTIVCIGCFSLGIGENMSHMIIGAIIPMVPGVSFVNGVRDIAQGDYIAGSVRLLDAILVFLCVAIGVGITFIVYHRVLGGAVL